jgi:predicted RNA binding protein YcfA (HicA-like mRNA interferase family)
MDSFSKELKVRTIYYNSLTNISVVVPIHNKELKRGTFMAIAKQAGIDKAAL